MARWSSPCVGLAVPVVRRFHRRLRRASSSSVLGRLAGLRLADQPLGRDRGPAARLAGRHRGSCAPSRAAPGPISRPSSRPSTTCCRRTISRKRPQPVVAQRTSPTNIGVYLLSVVSARDFGWISLADAAAPHRSDDDDDREAWSAIAAISSTGTTRRRWRRSTRSTCRASTAATSPAISSPSPPPAPNGPRRPSVHLQGDFDGILDCVTILDESLAELPDDRRQLRPLRKRLRDRVDGMRRAVDTIKTQPEMASIRTINLAVLASEIRKLAAAIDTEAESGAQRGSWPTGRSGWRPPARRMCRTRISTTRPSSVAAHSGWSSLRERAAPVRLRDGFLVPAAAGAQAAVDRLPRRGAPARRELLRPAGLGGAADQPVRHRQGRSADRALVPARPADRRDRLPRRADVVVGLDVRVPDAAAGDEGAAGRHPQPDQQADRSSGRSSTARSKGIPWGISEAAYNAPRPRADLPVHEFRRARPRPEARAWRRTPSIAPYATVLAAQFMPREAVDNLERLAGDRRARPLRLLRRRRLHAAARAGRRRPCRRLQLHGASPGHVDRGGRQRRVRRPHARPLPQRSGDRGGRTAAAGEGAARHSGRDGPHRGRRTRQAASDVEQSPDTRLVAQSGRARCARPA